MFHEGDLQSGIASALEQSKAVLCFVHDDEESSQAWENTILKNEEACSTVTGAIRSNTVALRIVAGSQEAKFLSSFCPIAAVPTVVFIQNGALKGVISHTPSTEDQLGSRILSLLGTPRARAGQNIVHEEDSATTTEPSSSVGHHDASHITPGPSHPEPVDQPSPGPILITPGSTSCETSDQENAPPLNCNNSGAESALGESSGTQANSQSAAPTNSSSQPKKPTSDSTPRQDWTRMQRERERQQRAERERIKAQIKYDHDERRRLDELRRQPAVDLTIPDTRNSAQSPSRCPDYSVVRLQVRTFEGSTFHSTFPKSATISTEVRAWIDVTARESTPYNLKIILAPQPNRTFEAAEEEKSLEDLDIIGSCTLVMVPVKGFVESYAPSRPGIVGSAFSGGYNLVSGSVGALLGGVRSVLGFGQVTSEPSAPSAPEDSPSQAPAGHVRVRTLADQRMEAQKKDQQFYNGNQLNFQPRKDDEDGKEDGQESMNQ